MNDGKTQPADAAPVSRLAESAAEALIKSGIVLPPRVAGTLGTVGRFEIERVLGAGGMGQVLLARDPTTGYRVAVKVIRPDLRADPLAVKMFLNEARHMFGMKHPSIVDVKEVCEDPACPYFAMPFVEGGSLADRLVASPPMTTDEIARTCLQIAEALAYAHAKGITHRDLKPHNVLLDRDGHAYLTDFGLARTVFNDSQVDVQRSGCEGTAAYMSPGVAEGIAEDTRCDIYSFGAMLYHMLTGCPPYAGPTAQAVIERIRRGPPRPIRELNPAASPALAKIAESAMARELRDRYAEMRDVVRDLNRVLEGGRPRVRRWAPRKAGRGSAVNWRWALLLAGLAAAAAVAGILALHRPPSPEATTLEPLAPAPAIPARVAPLSLAWTVEPPTPTSRLECLVGDYDGVGAPEIFQMDGGLFLVRSARGELLHKADIGGIASYAGLVRLLDCDADPRDEAVLAGANEDTMCGIILNQIGFALYRFEAPGKELRQDGYVVGHATLVPCLVADLDRDGKREMVATASSGYNLRPRGVYCFDLDSQDLKWSQPFGPNPRDASLSLVDLNQDGVLDVVCGSGALGNGNATPDGDTDMAAWLYALNGRTGERLWAVEMAGQFGTVDPLTGDTAGDGRMDILLAWAQEDDFPNGLGHSSIVSLSPEGQTRRRLDSDCAMPSCRLARLKPDAPTVLVATDYRGKLWVIDPKTLTEIRSVTVAEPSPAADRTVTMLHAVSDLDGDGDAELVVTTSRQRQVKAENPGYPDRPQNVAVFSDNTLHVYSSDLKPVGSFLVQKEYRRDPGFRAFVADFDEDGQWEILVTADRGYVLKLMQ